MRAFGRVLTRLRAFGALFAWLTRLMLRSARRHTIMALALGLLGTATHVAAIGIFLAFVHAQTTGGVLQVGPIELPASTDVGSLALWSAAVLLMALLTAATTYQSALMTFEAGRRAARSFLRQALTILTDSQMAHNRLLSSPEGRAMARRAFVGDSVVLLRTAVVGSGLFAPLLLFLLAIAALLRLNPLLTAGIAVPLALFLVPYWHHNRRVVTAARTYRVFIAQRSRGLKDLFEFLSQTHAAGSQAPAMLDATLNDPATTGFEKAIGQIMLRGQKVKYLKLLFLGVVLCGLLFAWGAFQSAGARSWSALVTYVVSLQYAVATMGSVASSLTSFTRYVPYLERMRALTLERPSPIAGARLRHDPVVRVAAPRLPGSASERSLAPGDVLACAHPVDLDAFTMPAFLEKLTGNRRDAAGLARQLYYCGSPPPQSAAAPDWADAADADESVRRLLETIGSAGDDADAGQTPEMLSYALQLLPGLAADRRLFILDWVPLRRMSRESQAAVLELLRDRVTILVLAGLPGKVPWAAGGIAVVDDQRALGVGESDWYADLDPDHPLLERFRSRADGPADELDDELDDETAFE